jgi:hypothetical protein
MEFFCSLLQSPLTMIIIPSITFHNLKFVLLHLIVSKVLRHFKILNNVVKYSSCHNIYIIRFVNLI